MSRDDDLGSYGDIIDNSMVVDDAVMMAHKLVKNGEPINEVLYMLVTSLVLLVADGW